MDGETYMAPRTGRREPVLGGCVLGLLSENLRGFLIFSLATLVIVVLDGTRAGTWMGSDAMK